MRKYRSHKEVEAAKITGVDREKGLVWCGDEELLQVPRDFFARSTPIVGDYIVRYSDGYLSHSPATAFEEGYTAL